MTFDALQSLQVVLLHLIFLSRMRLYGDRLQMFH